MWWKQNTPQQWDVCGVYATENKINPVWPLWKDSNYTSKFWGRNDRIKSSYLAFLHGHTNYRSISGQTVKSSLEQWKCQLVHTKSTVPVNCYIFKGSNKMRHVLKGQLSCRFTWGEKTSLFCTVNVRERTLLMILFVKWFNPWDIRHALGGWWRPDRLKHPRKR